MSNYLPETGIPKDIIITYHILKDRYNFCMFYFTKALPIINICTYKKFLNPPSAATYKITYHG